jgi:hypothetical protein
VDIANLAIHEYFNHYLTSVFPQQLDRMFESHNDDVTAHPVAFRELRATAGRVNRWGWMLAGMSALTGLAVTVGAIVRQWWR